MTDSAQALYFACGILFIFGFLSVFRQIGVWLTLVIVAVKVLFPLLYFSGQFGAPWVLLDDITYEEQAYFLLRSGLNPFEVFFDGEARDLIRSTVGGAHFLYTWWNYVAFLVLGDFYFSPVILNVALTFISARMLGRLARGCGFDQKYCSYLVALFLVHPETIVWSSFINLKDTLVITSTIGLLLGVQMVFQNRVLWGLMLVAFFVYLFSSLRFYIPFIMAVAVLGLLALRFSGWKRLVFLPPMLLVLYLITPMDSTATDLFRSDGALFGLMRFLLTPRPWNIEEDYSFLLIPTIVHYALFIPVLMVLPVFWRISTGTKLVLLYLAVVTVFYAFVPELQGPRHRAQVSFIFIWLQMHAVIILGRVFMKDQGVRPSLTPR